MTAVIGIYWFYGYSILSDTRISFKAGENYEYDTLHGVHKTILISDASNIVSLGFAGNLEGAKLINNYLGGRLSNYNKKLILPTLADRLGIWLERASKKLNETQLEGGLSYILCGCEPRQPLAVSTSPSLYKKYFRTYSILHPGKVDVNSPNENVVVIGSGKRLIKPIQKIFNSLSIRPKDPHDVTFRASVISDLVRQEFLDIEDKTVGGVWEIFSCDLSRQIWHKGYLWLNDNENQNIQINEHDGQVDIYNLANNERFHILKANDWIPSGRRATLELDVGV